MEDFQKQMAHDAGSIDVLMEDKNRLRSERDEWRRRYFFMERAQSACIDKNGEMIKRIQFLEREKDELRDSMSRLKSSVPLDPPPAKAPEELLKIVLRALKASERAIEHSVPGDCYATGPCTGDPIADLVVCPACS